MSFQVLTNCKVYADGYDLTGSSNKADLKYSADIKDDTVFGAGSKSRIAGLKNTDLSLEGFWEAGAGKIDTLAESYLGIPGKIITLSPEGGGQGDIFFAFKSILSDYQAGAEVGELLPFSYNASGSDAQGLIRGTVMENAAKTASANGTGRQLGAVAEDKHLYAVMHILAVSGTNPTLDLIVQSDDAAGFASATNRITFAQQTAIGAVWAARVAGPITDDCWRASWTIGGTDDPSFTVFVGLAIQ